MIFRAKSKRTGFHISDPQMAIRSGGTCAGRRSGVNNRSHLGIGSGKRGQDNSLLLPAREQTDRRMDTSLGDFIKPSIA